MAYKKAKRIRKLGTLEDARRELWRTIIRVKEVLNDDDSGADKTLKAAHCMQQCVSSYLRLLEASDQQKRIEALEEAMESKLQNTSLLRAA